jgi:hypothetical protein
MGSSKRNRASVTNKSGGRQKTAKKNPQDDRANEPYIALLEIPAVVNRGVGESPSVIVPALEKESISATKVEVPDFDIEKLMAYYHTYGVNCLVP